MDLKFWKQANLEEFMWPYLEYTAFLFGTVQVHKIPFLYIEKYCKSCQVTQMEIWQTSAVQLISAIITLIFLFFSWTK